ncbi:hypothetical protein ACKZDW_08925 [Ralstonia syzygii subsp. celebesensis]|uniref:3-isopropylmalate dehydratase n=1 Tax=blood disease bacterium A2-HR MARDI TaxID=1944648 RepID=A0A1U9VLG6_9RALS|nr:hypothetical protein [Ralstonia syzygii]AQW31406.1 hypothetical protein B0B51_01395 [blood disease bacterium A2-HR MARDI]QQV54650.1 hypothetical protein JK151_10745 [Ralstonia syzygii subsp. celebesensis]
MLRLLAVAAVAPFVAACATSSVSLDEARPVPAARLLAYQAASDSTAGHVVVTRDAGFLAGGCALGFYVDGKLAAAFKAGETASFNLLAGEHVIGVGSPGDAGFCLMPSSERREIEVLLTAGRTRYYRIAVRPGDGPSLEATTHR